MFAAAVSVVVVTLVYVVYVVVFDKNLMGAKRTFSSRRPEDGVKSSSSEAVSRVYRGKMH